MEKLPSVGVGVIVRRGDEVLLMLRKNSVGEGTWMAPGGILECGESMEECAIRETKEETNVDIKDVRFKAVTNDVFEDGTHYVNIWMEATVKDGELKVNAPGEMSGVGWFTWDALPQPLFLPFENLVNGVCYTTEEPWRTPA